jgi:hypothetical protein
MLGPDEFAMLIHELTHVIQQYPHSPIKRGWVTEGIADYVRFFHYQPGPAIGKSFHDGGRLSVSSSGHGIIGWVGIVELTSTGRRIHGRQAAARNRADRLRHSTAAALS